MELSYLFEQMSDYIGELQFEYENGDDETKERIEKVLKKVTRQALSIVDNFEDVEDIVDLSTCQFDQLDR